LASIGADGFHILSGQCGNGGLFFLVIVEINGKINAFGLLN